MTLLFSTISLVIPYSTKFWRGKILADRSFQGFGGGKCWRIYSSYCSESGIWLGKILANGVSFAKSAKVSPAKKFRYTVYLAMQLCSYVLLQSSIASAIDLAQKFTCRLQFCFHYCSIFNGQQQLAIFLFFLITRICRPNLLCRSSQWDNKVENQCHSPVSLVARLSSAQGIMVAV